MIDEEEDWPLIYSGTVGIEWTEEQKEEFIKQLKYVADEDLCKLCDKPVDNQ